jgi:hypothetical protein
MTRVANGAAHSFPSWERALRRAWQARRLRMLLEAFAGWAAVALPGLGLLFVIALWLPPSRVASGILAAAALAWLAGTLAWRALRPLLRTATLPEYALWLEQRAGLARNEFTNALALERDAPRWQASPISRDLVAMSLARAEATLAGLPLRSLHAVQPVVPRLARGALGLLPFLLAGVLLPARSGDALRLFLAAGRPLALPAITLTVEPGEASIARGSPVTIRAHIAGERRPAAVTLALRRPEGAWNRVPMAREELAGGTLSQATSGTLSTATGEARGDRYTFGIGALEGDLEYRVQAQWAESPVYHLRVLEPLQALGYRILYEAPAYTGIPPRHEVSSTGDLSALEGTRVTLEATHRRRGARGQLLFADGGTLALEALATDRLTGSWTITHAGRYCLELSDAREPRPWLSDSFQVELVPDLRPAVRLLHPSQAITMPPEMKVPLDIEALDDFGLSELALVYGRAQDNPTRIVLQRWPGGRAPKDLRLRHVWDLEELQILPGQEIYYFLQVQDNDPLHGPKSGETPLCTIRFPTMVEMYANAEEDRREEIRTLEQTLEQQTDLKRQLARVAQEMKRDESVSWERQQEIESLVQSQEELAAKVEQIQQSLAASQQRMENQNLFSMEILEKVREIQALVEEVQSREFQQALERLQRALESLDRRELQRAMEQMRVTQEEVAQALDRTLEMLKRLLADEQLDHLTQKAAELEARQAEVNRQLEEGGRENPERPLTPEERAELEAQQRALSQELEQLKQQLAELGKKNAEELPDMQQAIEQLLAQQGTQETPEQMRQALQAMQESDRGASLKFGRKAREGLKQMQQGMEQMSMFLDAAELEQMARSLYDTANRLVAVSSAEEALLEGVERLGPRELAVRQQELFEDVRQAGDSLMAVARKTPVIGRAQLRRVGEALDVIERTRDAFAGGQRTLGETLLGESMRSVNAATLAMLEAAMQMSQSNCSMSCPNPFNRLQTLSGQQQCLNRDTQQMMGACQTPRLTAGQQDAMMRLAARQEMIRQGLQEIQGDLEGTTGQMLGDAGRMIEEMEELVKELRGRQADPRIIERQERILSRLLNAQRSLRKQDETEERRSRTGEDPGQRTSPGYVDEGRSPAETLRRAMVRGSQDPVPGEYRRLVEAYLRSLVRTP